MHSIRPYCLSIAGFDPCGGAGVLSDIKVFEQLEVFGLGVTTSITYQNDSEFKGLRWCNMNEIESQMEALRKYPVKAVKIGLVKDSIMLEGILKKVKEMYGKVRTVWDPVLKATSGFTFHKGVPITDYILQNVSLLTPNTEEYEQLALEKQSGLNVLLKGGHSELKGTDILFLGNQKINIPGEPYGSETEKHGTGCVLSSAITAFLCKGMALDEACKKGKKYVEKFMLSNHSKLGYHK